MPTVTLKRANGLINKIAIDHLIRDLFDLTLREALDAVNQLLAGDELSFTVEDEDVVQRSVHELTSLGVSVEIIR